MVEQKLPARHAAQLRWPDSGCICPAGQGVQDCDDTPEFEKEPGGQTPSGAERPVAEQKLPAVQGLQEDWPARSWKLPAAQGDGDVMPVEGQELPCGHCMQLDCPVLFWYVPALQRIHFGCPMFACFLVRICKLQVQGLTWLPLHTRQLVLQTVPVFHWFVPMA